MPEQKSYTYKAKDGVDRLVPPYGFSKGGILTTSKPIENPNFILVEDKPAAPAPPTAAPLQPTASPAPLEGGQTQTNQTQETK